MKSFQGISVPTSAIKVQVDQGEKSMLDDGHQITEK